jgi:hypothetical protein
MTQPTSLQRCVLPLVRTRDPNSPGTRVRGSSITAAACHARGGASRPRQQASPGAPLTRVITFAAGHGSKRHGHGMFPPQQLSAVTPPLCRCPPRPPPSAAESSHPTACPARPLGWCILPAPFTCAKSPNEVGASSGQQVASGHVEDHPASRRVKAQAPAGRPPGQVGPGAGCEPEERVLSGRSPRAGALPGWLPSAGSLRPPLRAARATCQRRRAMEALHWRGLF